MPTGESHTGPSQEERNRDMLRGSEIGSIMERAYDDAIAVDPRLRDVAVRAIPADSVRPPIFALPRWAPDNQTGRHEVHIRLEDLPGTLDFLQKTFLSVQKNREILAADLRLPPEELTPSVVFLQGVLHEFGHGREYLQYEELGKSPDDHRRDVVQELDKLPVRHAKVGQLLTEGDSVRQQVLDNWKSASAMAAVNYSRYRRQPVSIRTMDDLVNATADVYRHSRFEAAADKFAAGILVGDPVLLEQALHPAVPGVDS
jgi:hypothetical protein